MDHDGEGNDAFLERLLAEVNLLENMNHEVNNNQDLIPAADDNLEPAIADRVVPLRDHDVIDNNQDIPRHDHVIEGNQLNADIPNPPVRNQENHDLHIREERYRRLQEIIRNGENQVARAREIFNRLYLEDNNMNRREERNLRGGDNFERIQDRFNNYDGEGRHIRRQNRPQDYNAQYRNYRRQDDIDERQEREEEHRAYDREDRNYGRRDKNYERESRYYDRQDRYEQGNRTGPIRRSGRFQKERDAAYWKSQYFQVKNQTSQVKRFLFFNK